MTHFGRSEQIRFLLFLDHNLEIERNRQGRVCKLSFNWIFIWNKNKTGFNRMSDFPFFFLQ